MLESSRIRGFLFEKRKDEKKMKRITRNLLLLIMAVSLLACFALTASAAEYESMDDAIGYLDSYADNSVAMYRQTNANGRTDEIFENNYGDFIIGVVGDEWFVVLRADGAVGYVSQDYFWDGNG